MKITKFVHSCLLVETDDRTALFDPGMYSTPHVSLESLNRLDDIFITHEHGDHKDIGFIKQAIAKFPTVRITTTNEVVQQLAAEGVKAAATPPAGVQLFDSPHENVQPLFARPEEIGIHYLDKLSHPGDCHHFKETKDILALPMQAPWGGSIRAATLAFELKPKYVLPIHDWHWNDQAREMMYSMFEAVLAEKGIKFVKLQTGQPVEITV